MSVEVFSSNCWVDAQGQGGFGSVFEATWQGKQVAVKVLLPQFSPSAQCHLLLHGPTSQEHPWDMDDDMGCMQVLGVDSSAKTMHFEALRREVQLASRFNSERLVQVLHDQLPSPFALLSNPSFGHKKPPLSTPKLYMRRAPYACEGHLG